MTRFRHGLLIGKFYPPHRGHHVAIRRGAAQCQRFTVVVMSSVRETIPLRDRVAWLRAEHASDGNVRVAGIPCDAPLDVDDPQVWAAQVAAMRAALRYDDPHAPPVDAVVSHDDYGAELARRFEATWIRVDRPEGEPSGTAVRDDLTATWHDLAPATKAGLATRVVVLGAESTGTTTVARALTERFRGRGGVWERTDCVEEYGREHTELKWTADVATAKTAGTTPPALDEIVWTTDDFDTVGAEQQARENAAASNGSPLLVCDTDAFATAIWERRYLGDDAREDPAYARGRGHVYLLTDHEGVPWHDDGMREGDLAVRAAMTGWFADRLTAHGHSWVLLTGSEEQRIDLAVRTTDQLLEHRLRFADPLYGPGFAPTPRRKA
ncbi:AAA family ATPase [Jatrophihabitans sp. YIM 134969]